MHFYLKKKLFDSYIACSGAFPDCENYFKELSHKAFQQINQFDGREIFITNGLKDPLDPDGEIHQQMIDFSKSLKSTFGNKVKHKYLTYENEGHVPFYSLYDGLRYVFEPDVKNDN